MTPADIAKIGTPRTDKLVIAEAIIDDGGGDCRPEVIVYRKTIKDVNAVRRQEQAITVLRGMLTCYALKESTGSPAHKLLAAVREHLEGKA